MIAAASLSVAVGSAFGAVSRYGCGQWIAKFNRSSFPWATWLVNMTGTLLLGLFYQAFAAAHSHPDLWLLSGTGFCGGFTTFSTMSVEAVTLFRQKFVLGLVYLGSSLAIGLMIAWVTIWWV